MIFNFFYLNISMMLNKILIQWVSVDVTTKAQHFLSLGIYWTKLFKLHLVFKVFQGKNKADN